MTRALRRAHRHAFAALALLLPAGVTLALLARAPLPSSASPALTRALGDAPRAPLTVTWQARAEHDGLTIVAGIGWAAPADGAPDAPPRAAMLELDVRSATGSPELLAYWSAAGVTGDPLPDGSVLLGPVRFAASRRFTLPDPARTQRGRVALYDVAHARVVATLDVPAAAAPPGHAAAGAHP